MQFFTVHTAEEARALLERPVPVPRTEQVPIGKARRRVLGEDLVAAVDLPEFTRSVVDGFAVRASDTFGASSGQPAFLRICGDVQMGRAASVELRPGGAVRVATGAMLPDGADAVVMVEYTGVVDEQTIEVLRPVAPGDGMVRRGDDVGEGQVVLPAGRRLRPQDISVLCSLGIVSVPVYRRSCVFVIPTGDEVVPVDQVPEPGQVRDANTMALCAAVSQDGCQPVPWSIAGDDAEQLRFAVNRGLEASDLVLLAGGSSVGTRDLTLDVLMGLPGAELLIHGVAIRPGKPVIVVALGGKLVMGLPGNPVSALIVYQEFVRPYLVRLSGERNPLPRQPILRAILTTNCSSDPGKEDYVRVKVWPVGESWMAEPLLGKSSLITPLVEADGIVTIPQNVEGLEGGEVVDVRLF